MANSMLSQKEREGLKPLPSLSWARDDYRKGIRVAYSCENYQQSAMYYHTSNKTLKCYKPQALRFTNPIQIVVNPQALSLPYFTSSSRGALCTSQNSALWREI